MFLKFQKIHFSTQIQLSAHEGGERQEALQFSKISNSFPIS